MGCRQSDLREAPSPPECNQVDVQQSHTSPHPQPTLPAVPSDSWYTRPFDEATTMQLTEFHMNQRGRAVFSNAFIPVSAVDLEELPGRSPVVSSNFEIGRDLIYGMAYMHNTPLFIEHRWRMRVSHFQKVCKEGVIGAPEKPDDEQSQKKHPSNRQDASSNTSDDQTRLRREQLSKTIYDRPYFDTFIGIKVFVDNELVRDHYPNSKSLPNCTATIDSSEAFSNWICVPIVLVGFLNNFLLSTIGLYRFLSLNFAEHMLRQNISAGDKRGSTDANSDPQRTFHVCVEVVYGCRAEGNFCTEHISRGSMEVVMTNRSKAALKSYEEKLRKIIQGQLSREQVLPMDRLALVMQEKSQRKFCLFCKSPLRFTCTVCGAQLCGMPSCVWKPFVGYPHGCSVHKSQT